MQIDFPFSSFFPFTNLCALDQKKNTKAKQTKAHQLQIQLWGSPQLVLQELLEVWTL